MRNGKGFTLIELLVAVVGVMALGGLSEVIRQQTIAQERAERWREIQFAMRIISQDLAQIHPRPTREEFGEDWQPSVLVNPSAQFPFELSRGGWANSVALPRGSVLRVAYDWEDDLLVRFHWSVMDRTSATPPIRTELLTGVEDIEIRLLDTSGEWLLDWPPSTMNGPERLVARPRVVEFGVILEDFGRVWRAVETGG